MDEVAKFRVANLYNDKIFMLPHLEDDIHIFYIKEERFECDKKWVSKYTTLEREKN